MQKTVQPNKQLLAEAINQLVLLQRQFAATLSKEMRHDIEAFVNEADLTTFRITDDEARELVGVSALMGNAVLDAQYPYLATLVKAVYAVGIRRGAAREAELRNNL